MEHIKTINLENVSENETKSYKIREAARAVVFDTNGLVALLHATKNFYYKLPGGGMEKGETMEEALDRECVEEIGCHCKITRELGITTEYCKQFELVKISYCYLAEIVGEKGNPKLEASEIEEGFETVPSREGIKE